MYSFEDNPGKSSLKKEDALIIDDQASVHNCSYHWPCTFLLYIICGFSFPISSWYFDDKDMDNGSYYVDHTIVGTKGAITNTFNIWNSSFPQTPISSTFI